ncbi:MAG: hypothetical protein ABSG53_13545 [Thermoguttaceae bacterium]
MGTDLNDFFADIDRIRLLPGQAVLHSKPGKNGTCSPAKTRVTGEFLKGPIPLPWLSAASQLAGKAPLAVGLALWFESGRRRSDEVTLTTAILNRFGVSRKAKYRGLNALEKAGLVNVVRSLHHNPVVTLIRSVPPLAPPGSTPS